MANLAENFIPVAEKIVIELQTATLTFNVYLDHNPDEEELFYNLAYAIDFIIKVSSMVEPLYFVQICINSPDYKYFIGRKQPYEDADEDFIALGILSEEDGEEFVVKRLCLNNEFNTASDNPLSPNNNNIGGNND